MLHSSFWSRVSSSSRQPKFSSCVLVMYASTFLFIEELEAHDFSMAKWPCPVVLVVALELSLLENMFFL